MRPSLSIGPSTRTSSSGDARWGASILEVLVAMLLGVFLLQLGLSTIQHLREQQQRAERRLDVLAASRVAGTVLRGELVRGGRSSDRSVGPDSIALRAFRGTGVVCALGATPDEVVVAFRGDRGPDPSKDSLEVTGREGRIHVRGLRAVSPAHASCPVADPRERALRLSVEGSVPSDAILVRIFESGSYHLTGSALRYRIGAGGRQPLTPEVWRDGGTGIVSRDSLLVLELDPLPGHGAWRSRFLAWAGR